MKEYLEGFGDALKSVPIVSAEYAALEKERDELKARMAKYEDLLRRSGLALAAEAGPERDAFVNKLYQDMHDFNSSLMVGSSNE